MLRKLIYLFATVLVLSASVARADVYYTGQVDVNGGVAGGVVVPNAASLGLVGNAGYSNTNAWSNGKLTALGIVPIANANGIDLGTGQRLVAVYALQGTVGGGGGTQTGDFRVENGAQGVIALYSVPTGGNGFLPYDVNGGVDPQFGVNRSAWTSGAPVAVLDIGTLPTAVLQGIGGVDPTVLVTGLLNTANANIAGATFTFDNNFKLSVVDDGTLFDDFNTVPPGPGFTKIDDAFFLDLDQDFFSSNYGIYGSQPTAAQLLGMNNLFNQIMSLVYAGYTAGFSGTVNPGDEYNPGGGFAIIGGVPTFGNGDVLLNNDGGFALPGAQFASQEVPEPASIILWGALTIAGGAYGARRRMLAKKA